MEDNSNYIGEGQEVMIACESIPSSWGGGKWRKLI
jgi:hypothetical protein